MVDDKLDTDVNAGICVVVEHRWEGCVARTLACGPCWNMEVTNMQSGCAHDHHNSDVHWVLHSLHRNPKEVSPNDIMDTEYRVKRTCARLREETPYSERERTIRTN